ncbi:MAG: plasmid pRiA4b ORF-3 family protein [bacterium]
MKTRQNKNQLHLYSLIISLNDWKPTIWRKLWIRGDVKLNILSYYIFSSMNWSGYHLSAFYIKNKTYSDISIDDSPEGWIDWKKFTIDDIYQFGLTQFQYEYDFGDSWTMTVKIKAEKNLDPSAPYPVCVNGANAAPPEDIGSYPGYEHFIKVMKKKKGKEYRELSDWWGEDSFDPVFFVIDEVNDVIQDEALLNEFLDEQID